MQLVKTDVHEDNFPHKGSVAQYEKQFGVEYGKPESVKVAQRKEWLKGCLPKC